MRISVGSWAVLACMLVPALVHAQVTVDLILDQEQYLRNESLGLKLRVNNLSGQTLRVGGDEDWLSFQIEAGDGKPLTPVRPLPRTAEFTIESSRAAVITADLMPIFEISQAGRYKITANVRLNQLQQDVSSAQKGFEVIQGATLWQRDIGVPGATENQLRKFTVVQANYLDQPRLSVRVSSFNDAEVLRVIPLAGIVSFGRPDIELDASNNLHVLFQSGARSFYYGIITVDAELIIRQTFDISSEVSPARPKLKRIEEDGRIIVNGGLRRITLNDLPPPPPPAPISTNLFNPPGLTNKPSTKTNQPAATPPKTTTPKATPANR